jgi:hypothetical protein
MNEDSNFIQLLVTELFKLIKLAVEKLSLKQIEASRILILGLFVAKLFAFVCLTFINLKKVDTK